MPTWYMMYFQDSASPSMFQLMKFHDFTMVVIITILILVGFNMLFISLNKSTNRFLMQEQFTEIIWTIIPIFILLSIALPSLQALYMLDDPFKANVTVKSIGHQWYWSYEYSDFLNINFDSYMVNESYPTLPRLLDTDNSLVLPILSKIRMIITSSDVIHSWTVPALGVKADATPGRLSQLMFMMTRTGIFFGQCSEICGANHSFMPIKLESVPMNYFINWINKMVD